MKANACKNDAAVLRTARGWRMGHSHHNAKLDEAAVRSLRHRHEVLGEGYLRLTRDTNLSRSTIRDICTYRTWRHVH